MICPNCDKEDCICVVSTLHNQLTKRLPRNKRTLTVNIIGDGSAGRRHARLLSERGHTCTMLGPDKASPVQHPGCDAVVIASPPETHKLYLSWYFDRCPILCEGPVTWYPGESDFFSHGMTASNWRFNPSIQALKKVLKTPVIGHFFFDYDLTKWRPDVDYRTTCYYTSGIDTINLHSVDLAFHLMGEPNKVCGVMVKSGKSLGIDAVCISLAHKNGSISTVNSSWHAARFLFGLRIVELDGTVHELSWDSPKDDSVCNVSYAAMIDTWLKGIETGTLPPGAPTLLDGYRAYEALQGRVVDARSPEAGVRI